MNTSPALWRTIRSGGPKVCSTSAMAVTPGRISCAGSARRGTPTYSRMIVHPHSSSRPSSALLLARRTPNPEVADEVVLVEQDHDQVGVDVQVEAVVEQRGEAAHLPVAELVDEDVGERIAQGGL